MKFFVPLISVLVLTSFLSNRYYFNEEIPPGIDDFIISDSIIKLIGASKDKTLSYDDRKAFIDRAYATSLVVKDDSVRNSYLLDISLAYYKLKDSSNFRKINRLSTALSSKLKDSTSLAANFWDLGDFFKRNGIKDSAFYAYSKSQKFYEALNNDYRSGTMLLNMAIIQSDIKDYTGSEITTTRAITLLKPLDRFRQLYKCYNNLAIVFNNLEEYDKAVRYHNIALGYQKKLSRENTLRENTLNNIGVVYQNKKNFAKAITYFNQALSTKDLKSRDVKIYAMLISNLAYNQFKLNDTSEIVEQRLFLSLRLRDSIGDHLGLAMTKLHLAEYFVKIKDTATAIKFATETQQLAGSTDNYRELLPAILMLSKIDSKNRSYYYDRYIDLSDSLQKQERTIRNKFAHIEFETKEVVDQNVRLSRQKEIILYLAGFVILTGLLLYIIAYQRSRNKKLFFEHQQQKSNEDIYNLMLSQQFKLDEGRRKEKKRISEELHDGVLGKLFGTRLLLGSLNNKSDSDTAKKREKYINELKGIEEELRDISHELNAKSVAGDIGYKEMINSLLDKQSQITNFKYSFECDDSINWEEFEGSLKMNLYRIIQESVQNISKYSKATMVEIAFKMNHHTLSLTINDNGKGFNTDAKSSGIGLKNIRSRVHKLKGNLEINSILKRGTFIKIRVPHYG